MAGYLNVVLFCISLVIKDTDFFHVLVGHFFSVSFEKYPLRKFSHFKIRLFARACVEFFESLVYFRHLFCSQMTSIDSVSSLAVSHHDL